MKIRIFENRGIVKYWIDTETLKIYRNGKNKYIEVKQYNGKYGVAVPLQIYIDTTTNRNRTRGTYMANIVGKYVFPQTKKYYVHYKDGNKYNFTIDNIEFRHVSDISTNWKQLSENETFYINDDGVIYDTKSCSFIDYTKDCSGYFHTSFNGKNIKRSRLVWKYFNGSEIPNGYVIDHIDNNCQNDNINNLQCITVRENIAKETSKKRELPVGVIKKGNKYGAYINYTINDVRYENKYLGQFNTPQEASDAYQRALSLVEQGINPIKSGDEINIKYKFATDKWYFNMPQYKSADKYYGDYDTYDEALLAYNKHFTLDKANESETDMILRRGYFSFKVTEKQSHIIYNNKYTTKAFLKAFDFYKECKEKKNINLLVEKLKDLRTEIENEGKLAKTILDKQERERKEKLARERQKERELRKVLQIEYRNKQRIDHVNKPNYTSHTYDNGSVTYVFNVPYSDGKSYYLTSFMDKDIVDEIDNIMNIHKMQTDFVEWFNNFKLNELNPYILKDKLYRNNKRSTENNTSGYKWYKPRNCWRARKKINNKDYILGYFDDERCCQTMIAEVNAAIATHSFDIWYKDIESHKMRIRKMFNDNTLNSSTCKYVDDLIDKGYTIEKSNEFNYRQTTKRVVLGNKKKVKQIKDGEVINIFDTLVEANKQFNNKHGDKAISRCCTGKTKSYKGYQWEYVS